MLREATDLLDRIVNGTHSAATRAADGTAYPPLLAAIADGTFGLMKRPPEAGKGLDGVIERATGPQGYDNPAITALDAWCLDTRAAQSEGALG